MNCVVLTSCTNRKRLAPDETLCGANLVRGDLDTVAEAWAHRLRSTHPSTRADLLYCGRAFRDAKVAADRAQAALYIVSAGLGLVPAHAQVPSYSLTITPGSRECVLSRLSPTYAAAQWWAELVCRSPFSHQLAAVVQRLRGPVLIALPAAYLAMVSAEIEGLPREAQRGLRIFTRMPSRSIPAALKPHAMPYDARLDGEGTPYPGTHGDFAQRALLHFVEKILPYEPRGNHAKHAAAVDASLANLRAPLIHNRKRLSDRDVISLIHGHWDSVSGQSGRMLRFLRDDLNVACEQSRFRSLFHVAKDERGAIR